MNWSPTSHTVPVAHRGLSCYAPENTLVAYVEALEAGATHVECDVHLSADGTPYVIHDSSVERTTDGRGAVATLSDEELSGLDAGGWKNPRYRGEPLPTLDALLRLLNGRASLALEIKAAAMERAVLDAVAQVGFAKGSLTIFAFEFAVLENIRALDPELHTTFLLDGVRDDAEWSRALGRCADAGIRAVGPGNGTVRERWVVEAQSEGLSVYVWTVDDAIRMKELSGWGVDAIMTNDIALGRRALLSA